MALTSGLLTTALASQLVLGQLDLGSGRNGDLQVDAGVTISINGGSGLVADALAGTGTLTVANATPFRAQQLVLVVQMQVSALPAADDAGIIDLSPSAVGEFEFARVLSVVGADVVLTAPLQKSFVGRSQAVVVPEYRRAVVDGTVVAPRWDGFHGGIVAMLVAEELSGSGTLSAVGAGFRPAPLLRSDGQPCVSPWVPAGVLLATAEGLLTSQGWGPAATPLAGGSAGLSVGSGGGGSHIGVGGGGLGAADGQGGQAVRYSPLARLVMGGGGGLVGGLDTWGGWGATLAQGGGVIFVRARTVAGSLFFDASATNPGGMVNGTVGGVLSGAAGGLIRVETQGVLACGWARAHGSVGRSYTGQGSAGGGGGGGRVVLAGSVSACSASSAAGLGGSSGATLLPPLSTADPRAIGDTVVGPPSGSPLAPRIISPASLSTVSPQPTVTGVVPGGPALDVRLYANGVLSGQSTTDDAGAFSVDVAPALSLGWSRLAVTAGASVESLPSEPVYVWVASDAGVAGLQSLAFVSTPNTSGECGVPYAYSAQGTPQLNLQDGVSFSVEGVEGQALPAGLFVDSATGAIYWVPTVAQRMVPMRLMARRGAETAEQVFAVQVACAVKVGCGCGASGFEGAWVLLALVPWRARRRKATPPAQPQQQETGRGGEQLR